MALVNERGSGRQLHQLTTNDQPATHGTQASDLAIEQFAACVLDVVRETHMCGGEGGHAVHSQL